MPRFRIANIIFYGSEGIMKIQKLIIAILIGVLIFISPFFVSKLDEVTKNVEMTRSVEYIEVVSTGVNIYLKNIRVIEPTIWKGSYDGILHYKNGDKVEIDISYYGNFFGIKGEERRLFSEDVLYEYEVQ